MFVAPFECFQNQLLSFVSKAHLEHYHNATPSLGANTDESPQTHTGTCSFINDNAKSTTMKYIIFHFF